MPIVLPDPDQFQRRIPQPTRGFVRAADTSAVTRGAMDMAGAMQSLANDIQVAKKRNDDIAVEEATNSLLRESMNLTIGDDGYTKQLGGNVITNKTLDTYKKRFEDVRKGIAEKLGNTDQQDAFKRATERISLGFDADLIRHVSKQADVYDGDVLKGTLETNSSLAGQVWNRADENGRSADLEALADRSEAAINTRAARLGTEPQMWQAARAEGRSSVFASAIMSAIDAGDTKAAETYLKNYGDQLTEKDRARIEKPLADQKITTATNAIYREIVSTSMTEGEAAKAVAQIESPELRKRVREQVNGYFTDMKAAKDEAYNPVSSLLGDANAQSAMIPMAQADRALVPLRSTHPDLYEKGRKEIYAHNEKIRTDRHQAQTRAKEVTENSKDADVRYLRLRYDMMRNPQTYRNADGNAIAEMVGSGKLKASQAKELQDIQQKIRDGDTTGFTTFTSAEELLNRRLRESTFGGKSYAKMKPAEKQAIQDQVIPQIDSTLKLLQESKGGKLSAAEVKDVVDSAFTEKVVSGTFSDSTVTEFNMTGLSQRYDMRAVEREIPPDALRDIKSALQRDGEPITPEAIINIWNKANGR